MKPFVDQIELNGLCLSGRLADAGHGFSFQDGVDQARLPDVRATDHGELRPLVVRKVLGLVRRPVKLDCSNVQLMIVVASGDAKAEC